MPKRQANTSEALTLAQAKLSESQISLDEAKNMGMEVLDPLETRALGETFQALPSIKINYVDPWTRALMSARPKWPPFFRVRYLYSRGAIAAKDGIKLQRYGQMAGVGACAYFPPVIDWPSVFDDTTRTIYITEGEFKAAKACLENLPTIGLGGAWMFKSPQIGATFLPELEKIGAGWIRRRVVIVYDSDMRDNDDVLSAVNALSEELKDRGALVHCGVLPALSDPDKKVGLDDFLVQYSASEFLRVVDERARHTTLVKTLFYFNDTYAVIRKPGLVVNIGDGSKSSFQIFTTVEGHSAYLETYMGKGGQEITDMVQASGAWLKWPLRRTLAKITYAPGQPKFITNCHPDNTAYNDWQGWGVGDQYTPMKSKPKNYDVRLFKKLFNHLMQDESKEMQKWFMQWLAYPIKHPGVKMSIAVVMFGVMTGTGKTLLGEILGKIYGENYKSLKPKDLDSDFNSWAVNRQLVHSDDVSGSQRYSSADMYKKMLDQEFISVNIKHVQQYDVPDTINYYFTTNRPDAFLIEDVDRRLVVFRAPNKAMSDPENTEIADWKNGIGPEHVRWFLENEVDLEGFNPRARAPMTDAKAEMSRTSQSELSVWIEDLVQDSDAMLVMHRAGDVIKIVGDLFSSKRLLRIFQNNTGITNPKLTPNVMGAALSAKQFLLVNKGKGVKLSNGYQDRYWAIRNRSKWVNAPLYMIKDHLDATRKFEEMPQMKIELSEIPEPLRSKVLVALEKNKGIVK